MMRLISSTAICLSIMASAAMSEQKLDLRADKTASFWAAVGGVTRVSVEGDRIRKLVHDESTFETMNDEETGDVFMRYVGDQSKLVPETGHIITESGATIAYEIKPKVSAEAETVIISIKGRAAKPAEGSAASSAVSAEPAPFLDETATSSGAGGYSDSLVSFTRKMIVEHIGRKPPPKAGAGAVIATERSGGFKARVMVASGGAAGGLVRPQSYYTPKVLAVWVDKSSLGPNETAWVVIVEAAK